MGITTLSTFEFGNTTARFQLDEASGLVGLELFPSALRDKLVPRRQTLLEDPKQDFLYGVLFTK